MGKDVIVACDFPSAGETLAFLDKLGSARPFVKIGMELYYAEGPGIVRTLKERGHKVFLDLKLHDIPNTVKKAMAVLSCLGADIVNVHAAGTKAMMAAALEGLVRPDGSRPLLIAVTQLTSTDQERMTNEILIDKPLEEVVMTYAKNADKAGLDGVAEISIFNRQDEFWERAQVNAERLKEKTGCRAEAFHLEDRDALRREIEDSVLLANGTSCGFADQAGLSPIPDESFLRPELIVTDAIYSPARTALLEMAEKET